MNRTVNESLTVAKRCSRCHMTDDDYTKCKGITTLRRKMLTSCLPGYLEKKQMKMKIKTRMDLAKATPARWRETYANGRYGARLLDILFVLELLDPVTPDAVDEAIGNSSWTTITCDSCKESVPAAVEMRSQWDDEYGPCFYCADCIGLAAEAFEDLENGE